MSQKPTGSDSHSCPTTSDVTFWSRMFLSNQDLPPGSLGLVSVLCDVQKRSLAACRSSHPILCWWDGFWLLYLDCTGWGRNYPCHGPFPAFVSSTEATWCLFSFKPSDPRCFFSKCQIFSTASYWSIFLWKSQCFRKSQSWQSISWFSRCSRPSSP